MTTWLTVLCVYFMNEKEQNSECPSQTQMIQNAVYKHTMKYYSAFEENSDTHYSTDELRGHYYAHEITSQSPKDRYTMILLTRGTQSSQFTETESRMPLVRQGKGTGELFLKV